MNTNQKGQGSKQGGTGSGSKQSGNPGTAQGGKYDQKIDQGRDLPKKQDDKLSDTEPRTGRYPQEKR